MINTSRVSHQPSTAVVHITMFTALGSVESEVWDMSPKIFFIIYVTDQARSTKFYKGVLGLDPSLNVPGMTEFPLSQDTSLGIMPEQATRSFLGDQVPKPESATGIPRCEFYLFVDDPADSLLKLTEAGGKKVSNPRPRPWGDVVAYGLDPDGHVLAFAKSGA